MNQDQEKQIIERSGIEDGIFDLKNVQSFYPGTKIKNGVDTGEPCMVIGVTKKENIENLEGKDLIPGVLGGSVKTDIVEESEISRYGGCAGRETIGTNSVPSGPCDGHDYKKSGDPFINAHGGISIGPSDSLRLWSGTLGFIARDKIDKKLVGVSNNHVLGDYVDTFYSHLGCYLDGEEVLDAFKVDKNLKPIVENIIQTPSVPDATGGSVVLGKVKRSIPTKWGSGWLPDNTVDAGIVELSESIQPMVDLTGLSEDALTVGEAKIGARVSKSGRTTGVTGVSDEVSNPTTIVSTNYTVAISSGCGDGLKTKFSNCIKFNWNAGRNNNWEFFSYAGDSGSAIMMDDSGQKKLIGLLFAGTHFSSSNNMPNPPYGTGVACKIDSVFNALNIEPWNGRVVCANDSNFIKINGSCYKSSRAEKPIQQVTHTEHAGHATEEQCLNN